MSTYYLHDGRNEIGPFSIDILKKQKLTRNTPVRQKDTNSWMPAEKLGELKEIVAPRKIRRPKDIVPVVMERVSEFKQKRPKTLYACLFFLALIAGVSIYSIGKSSGKNFSAPSSLIQPQVSLAAKNITGNDSSKKIVEEKTVIKEDARKTARLQWKKLIVSGGSSYGIGFLGGIKDLNVVVNNRSDYPIDEAIVKVTYIKANGGTWKTKLISLYNVPAHDSKEQSVPDVKRGKKARAGLYKVVSKRMNFSYTEGQRIKNPEDPYYKE